jgi:hypothetical protein
MSIPHSSRVGLGAGSSRGYTIMAHGQRSQHSQGCGLGMYMIRINTRTEGRCRALELKMRAKEEIILSLGRFDGHNHPEKKLAHKQRNIKRQSSRVAARIGSCLRSYEEDPSQEDNTYRGTLPQKVTLQRAPTSGVLIFTIHSIPACTASLIPRHDSATFQFDSHPPSYRVRA